MAESRQPEAGVGTPPEAVSDLTMHLAYAEASIMLVECLMQALMDKKLITSEELVEAVETAIEAKQRLIQDGSHPQLAAVAAGVLSRLANSVAALQPSEPNSPQMPPPK